MTPRFRRAAAGLLILAAACGSVDTHDPQRGFVLISQAEEFAIGDQFARSLERGSRRHGVPPAKFIEVPDAYLAALGRELLGLSKRADVPCRFYVIDEKTINAFAVPGHIYVYRGLVELCETEAEFAAVLGHEIGHVVARHSAKKISQHYAVSGGTEFVLAALGAGELAANLGYLAMVGALKKFGRDDERQADLLGLEECTAAGIDPRGAASVFRKFEKTFRERPNLLEGFFSDHPYSGERAENVELWLKANPPPPGLRSDRPAYQAWRSAVLAAGRTEATR